MDLFGETNFLFLTHGDLLYIYQGFTYLKVDQFLVNSIMVLGKLRLRKICVVIQTSYYFENILILLGLVLAR